MDPQNTSPQPQISTPSVVPTPAAVPVVLPQKKSSRLKWLIAGIVVLLVGIGIGMLFGRKPM